MAGGVEVPEGCLADSGNILSDITMASKKGGDGLVWGVALQEGVEFYRVGDEASEAS